MKTIFALALAILATAFFACKHGDDSMADEMDGLYIGTGEYRSAWLQEIFTSPTTSEWRWVQDSSFVDPDTLIIRSISNDSFCLEGRLAQNVNQEVLKFAWRDSIQAAGGYRYLNNHNYSGYFSYELILMFYPAERSLEIDYTANGYQSSGSVRFSGKR